MPYLTNAWYVAGWSAELDEGQLLPRTFLERPVVLFRDESGQAGALTDMCAHRFAPLSRGKTVDGHVQCGYHGLRFDRSGACVFSPQTPDRPPPNAKVHAYPTVERQTLIWIWMGNPALADPALIPDYPILADPALTPVTGYSLINGHYMLVVDNLMDLSHPEFLHTGSLGSPANSTAQYTVEVKGSRAVRSNRWFDAGPIPPAFEQRYPSSGKPVQHWANMRWEAPSNLVLDVGVAEVGMPRSTGHNSWSGHLLTPEVAA